MQKSRVVNVGDETSLGKGGHGCKVFIPQVSRFGPQSLTILGGFQ